MVTDEPILEFALLGGLAVFSATLYGIAALWASRGRWGWLWRFSPLALLLAALAPIGAYELIAFHGAQAAVVIGALGLGRIVRSWRTKRRARAAATANTPNECLSPARRAPLQFLLRDMLKAILLAAAVLAIVHYRAPNVLGMRDRRLWVTTGVGFGAVTLAAAWAVWGRRRWYLRAIVFVLVTAAAGGVTEFLGDPLGFTVLAARGVLKPSWGWCLLWIGLFGLFMAIWLLLIRRAGWAWWRRKSIPWNWPARVAICAVSLPGLCLLGSTYWALLPPKPPTQEPLPTPNGYDDLLRAGTALNWTAIPNQDTDTATIEACQAFLQTNASSLASMRQAFSKPCQVPVDFSKISSSTIEADFLHAFRDLGHALSVEGKVAVATGKFGDAMQSYLDAMRLAQKLSRGGLVIQEIVVNGIEDAGLQGIVDEMNHLDAASLALLVQTLDGFVEWREPLEKVLEGERAWRNLEYGWTGRLLLWLEETIDGSFSGQSLPTSRARNVARLRLILAEAAIRRHVLSEGSPPESLASLVPKYLSAVPQDPFGQGPLVYRRTADGYLLYSVGANGTDDGGQRVTTREATFERKGDLFFDVPYAPEESEDAQERRR